MSTGRLLLCCSATLCGGVALAACGSTGTPAGAVSHAAPQGSRPAAPAASGSHSASGCDGTSAPPPRGAQQIPKPTLKLDRSKRYRVTLTTNCGAITIQLDVTRSPATTASFAYLVQRGFYDDLTFHRVAAGFVIQGGDPNGDGSGGPGYTVVEPPPSDVHYTQGTVAMAKTGTDPAGASGSQFFIVTAPEAPLPPQYALVGHVVGGMAAVQAIASLPTDPPQDGTPTRPVVIRSARLSVA